MPHDEPAAPSSDRDSFTTAAAPLADDANRRYYTLTDEHDRLFAEARAEHCEPPRRHICKLLLAFAFTCSSAFLNFFLLVIVHDHTPRTAPLPDILFMVIPQQKWAWPASDWMSFLAGVITVTLCICHKYRWLVLRRAFTMFGIMFGLRSLCLATTFLPPSFEHKEETCQAQANWTRINIFDILTRFGSYMITMGLTSGQDQILCGDLMFSGHTTVLTLMYLITKRYSPPRASWLRAVQWPLCYLGILFVLISGGHYTIDVLIAYWLATHVFYAYHQQFELPKTVQQRAPLAHLWWFAVFSWLESDVPEGRVPNLLQWPFPGPKCIVDAFESYNHSGASCAVRLRHHYDGEALVCFCLPCLRAKLQREHNAQSKSNTKTDGDGATVPLDSITVERSDAANG